MGYTLYIIRNKRVCLWVCQQAGVGPSEEHEQARLVLLEILFD